MRALPIFPDEVYAVLHRVKAFEGLGLWMVYEGDT